MEPKTKKKKSILNLVTLLIAGFAFVGMLLVNFSGGEEGLLKKEIKELKKELKENQKTINDLEINVAESKEMVNELENKKEKSEKTLDEHGKRIGELENFTQ